MHRCAARLMRGQGLERMGGRGGSQTLTRSLAQAAGNPRAHTYTYICIKILQLHTHTHKLRAHHQMEESLGG